MSLLADIRQSARSLGQQPGSTFALMLTVALGIGSNAAVRSFMTGLVGRTAPIADDRRTIVSIFSRGADGGLALLTSREFTALAAQTGIFDAVVGALETRGTIELGERSAVAAIATLTPEARTLLRLPPGDGAVLSEAFRRRELGAVRDLTAQQVNVDGTAYPIAGEAPASLEGLYIGRPIDVWLLLPEGASPGTTGDGRTLSVVARLREDRSLHDAEKAVDALTGSGAALAAIRYTGLAPEMQSGMGRLARLLPAVAGAVFLIACANVAIFLLSRASARSHDTSLRLALGATRASLARSVFVDGALIAVGGTAAGLLMATWTAGVIPALLFEADAGEMTFAQDKASVIAAAVASAIVTLACGMVPLLENRHDTPAAVLRREPRRPSKPLRRLRTVLVVFQMSACCALVIGAAALADALNAALRTSAAERLGRPILATVESKHRFDRPDLGLDYFRRVEQSVINEPHVIAAAWTGTLPGGGGASLYPVRIERPGLTTREVKASAGLFTPRSLPQVVLPPVRGRMFGGRDTASTCRVAIVAESTAAAWFGRDPVGRVVEDETGQRVEIVGVFTPASPPPKTPASGAPAMYYYAGQGEVPFGSGAAVTFTIPVLPEITQGLLDVKVVSRSYFTLMGLSLADGLLFADEGSPDFCRVGVVNEEAAQLYFGGNAVGGAVIDGQGRRTTVVGVIRDVPLRGTARKSQPSIYVPMAQDFLPRMHLILGSRSDGGEAQSAVRRQVESVEGGRPDAIVVVGLDERLRQTALGAERIAALLLGAASINALAIGILGLHRVLADDVLLRRREIAIRSALGAPRWRLTGMAMVQAARVVTVAGACGIIASILLVRWMRGITGFEGGPPGLAWLAGPAVLLVAAVVATLLPIRRILSVSPLRALRTD